MTLYIGDKPVGLYKVVEKKVPKVKYGVSIDNLLGDINASGGLAGPTEPFSLDLTGVKELLGYGWAYKFYQNQAIVSANLSTLVIVDSNGLSYTFYQCENLESVNFDSLAKITGYASMASCFYKCKKLKKISFPALTSIADGAFGTWSFDYVFAESGVEEIHFRADMQATVEALTGYSEKFGATNATIYFD